MTLHINGIENPVLKSCYRSKKTFKFWFDYFTTLRIVFYIYLYNIERIGDTNQKSQEQISRIILQRENFWIVKLKTLTPHGFNQELN